MLVPQLQDLYLESSWILCADHARCLEKCAAGVLGWFPFNRRHSSPSIWIIAMTSIIKTNSACQVAVLPLLLLGGRRTLAAPAQLLAVWLWVWVVAHFGCIICVISISTPISNLDPSSMIKIGNWIELNAPHKHAQIMWGKPITQSQLNKSRHNHDNHTGFKSSQWHASWKNKDEFFIFHDPCGDFLVKHVPWGNPWQS